MRKSADLSEGSDSGDLAGSGARKRVSGFPRDPEQPPCMEGSEGHGSKDGHTWSWAPGRMHRHPRIVLVLQIY